MGTFGQFNRTLDTHMTICPTAASPYFLKQVQVAIDGSNVVQGLAMSASLAESRLACTAHKIIFTVLLSFRRTFEHFQEHQTLQMHRHKNCSFREN